MRWSIGRFSSPRQYAPATRISLNGADLARVLHMRAAAEVQERPLLLDADLSPGRFSMISIL